jgi:hypothetical protein
MTDETSDRALGSIEDYGLVKLRLIVVKPCLILGLEGARLEGCVSMARKLRLQATDIAACPEHSIANPA